MNHNLSAGSATGLVAEQSARQHAQIAQNSSTWRQSRDSRSSDSLSTQRSDRPGLSAVDEGIQVSTSQNHKPKGVLDAFEKTCQRWGLSKDKQKILLGDQPSIFFGRQSLVGHTKVVSRDMKDRVGYIVAISLGLGILFDENIELERRWLKRLHEKLQSKSPLDYMLEGSMQNLIIISDIVEGERGI